MCVATRSRHAVARGVVVCLLALACAGAAAAEVAPGWRADHWTPSDGLPVNALSDLAQTPDGYVWISTFGGLVRFDGARFRLFDTARAGLPSNRLTALAVGSDGRLFVASEQKHLASVKDGAVTDHTADLPGGRVSAFFRLDGELCFGTSGGFACYVDGAIVPVETQVGAPVVSAARAADGTLFVATENGPPRRAGPGGLFADVPGAPPGPLHVLSVDERGGLLAGGENGLFRLDGERWTAVPLETACGPTAVFSISADDDGARWLGTSCGLLRLTSGGAVPVGAGPPSTVLGRAVLARPGLPAVVRAAREIQVAGETLLRSPTVVTAHLVDTEGGIWVAAVGRLTRLQRQPVRRLGEGLPPFNAYTVFEDRDGDVWVGTADQGVLRFRGGSLVERVDEARGLPAAHAWSVARAPDGTPWIGSFGLCRMVGDACERVPMEGLASRQQVRAVYFDRHGRLWVGADPGLFRGDGGRVVRVADLPERPVTAFAEDARGVLWAATSGAGLWRIADEGVRVFGAESGLPSLLLRSVRPDADGGLWLASEDRGLLYALPVGDRLLVRAIGTNEGLPVDGVHQVLDDGGGHLWMSSNYGIFRARRADLLELVRGRAARVPTVLYGERDGLPHREANGGVQSAGARLRDGRLLFPTQGGVAVVDPAVARPRPWRPTPRFEGVTAGDRPLAPEGGAFRLEPHERDFAVAFTAPAFARPEDTRFRHRLDGFDADWIEGRESHRAFYTRVAPGRYRFRVAARDADHDWLEADAPLEIVVRPRFHETPWFAALVVLAVLAVVAGLVRVRIRRLLANERALAAMVADRTAQLERSTAAARAGQREVERQATALRALDEVKTRFFAHIHHELRTPLTLIAGPLDELLRGDVPPGLRPPLELMQRNARRLRRLTDQILDLERGEAGLRPTSLAPVDLRQLAERTLEPFRAVAGRRRFSLRGEGPAVALADPELTETVLTNLLSNAVKFTEEGGRVEVAVERAGDRVRLSVVDDGCGIPEADQPRIFDRFYRVESDGLRSGEGSGLGLALVRQLVTAQGGEVFVESRPGEGARFLVTLVACEAAPGPAVVGERADAEAALLAAHPCADDPAEPGRPTVLVVDDNPDLRRFVGALLSPRHAVRYASDGEAGLKRARDELPDLVVADVMMPGLDGLALAAALAADPETTAIPVLLLTARAGVEAEVRGLRSGAVDFLGKPFDAEVLRARVDVILGRRTRLRDALRGEPSPAPPAAEPEVSARVRAVVLARLDDETLDAEALARAVGMSRPTLSRRLAAEGAPSPAAFVRAVRLERAHALLSEGAGNVSEVAVAVGFNSLAQFSRAFREAHGVPPSHVIPRG